MRVLFITRKFPPSVGGMEMYSMHLHQALKQEFAELDLFKPAKDMLGRPSPLQLAGFFLAATWYLLRNGRNYDAVLLGDYAIASLAIVAKLSTRSRIGTVVSLHGNDLYFMRKRSFSAKLYKLISFLVVSSRTLDASIANSQAIAEEAHRRGVRPVHVIPLATTTPEIEAQQTQRKPGQLLFAGRLIRYKGLAWFMANVWPLLPETTSLIVAGPVWDQSELESIQDVPRVTYLGSLPPSEIPRLRAESIACIMPNLPSDGVEQDEGFGIAALEGPAVGTPTLGSRCAGLADAIEDGITGFLIPPLDASMWVSRIREIDSWSQVDWAGFGERSREHVARNFNWPLVASRTASVLRSVATQPKSDI